jgi:hypothetical protein
MFFFNRSSRESIHKIPGDPPRQIYLLDIHDFCSFEKTPLLALRNGVCGFNPWRPLGLGYRICKDNSFF